MIEEAEFSAAVRPPFCELTGELCSYKLPLIMLNLSGVLWGDESEDVAEYAVMLALILIIVVAAIRLVGSNASNVFSQVGSKLN